MKLKEQWGTKVWECYSTRELIRGKLNEADGGQVEELQEKVEMLTEMLGNLMDSMNMTDKMKLEIVGIYGWELVK
jgi:hypothetical protein